MHIDTDAHFLQTVAGHQHATVILHHALAVAVDIVQRQHHPQTDGSVPHVIVFFLCGLGCHLCLMALRHLLTLVRLLGLGTMLREGDLYFHSLFQLEVGHPHLGIGLNQFVDGDLIHSGDAEDGLLTFHFMQSADGWSILSQDDTGTHKQQCKQQKIS